MSGINMELIKLEVDISGIKSYLRTTEYIQIKYMTSTPASAKVIRLKSELVELEKKRSELIKSQSVGDQGDKNKVPESMRIEITNIERMTDISADAKVNKITHICCATCSAVAVQPIPFADYFILTPIQIYMGSRIAAIREVPMSDADVSIVMKEIFGALGMGFVAQQVALGVWKFVIPGASGFMTIPIVYGLTFAIMRVMDSYFIAKAAKIVLTQSEMRNIWKNSIAESDRLHAEK